MTPKPVDYGVPQHDEWRPHQLQAVEHALQTRSGISIYEQPTGSGKTAFGSAIASRFDKSLSLCTTRALQGQYAGYGWYVMSGKRNYPCCHSDVEYGTMADECLSPENAHHCPFAYACEYLRAKAEAEASPMVNLNYSLWLSSQWARRLGFDYMLCDEIHTLSDLVLDWVGCTIAQKDILSYDLPAIPKIENMTNSIMISEVNPISEALKWLGRAMEKLKCDLAALSDEGFVNPDKRKVYNRISGMHTKLETVADALVENGQDWYIRSGLENGIPKLIFRPLTARFHAPKMFSVPKIVMMSATIGVPDIMAKELGIPAFRFMSVPSVWPPETRPIYVLDCPSMGATATKKDPSSFDKQAEVIAEFINRYPKTWGGFILVTRKPEAQLLAGRLAKLGLHDRVWVTPESDTGTQMRQWQERKKRRPNTLTIAWSFWEGIDGVDEKILVCAKVPYPPRGEPGSYEHTRMEYDIKYYNQQTALKLEQGCGRIRRGDPSHYDLNGVAAKAVAICDGSINRVRKYFSQSFREALVYERDGGDAG